MKIKMTQAVLLFYEKKGEQKMLDKLKEIIAEKLGAEVEEITEETRFKEDLQADSLDLFELVMAIEEEFGTSIPSEDLEKLLTVGDVIDYMNKQGIEG